MRAARLPLLLCALLALPAEAHAQGFLERLFGAPPRQAPPPPAPIPPASIPAAPSAPPIGDSDPSAPRPQPSGPPPPRPIVLKPISEDSVLGRDLKLNGAAGSLRLDRAGAGLGARAAFQGTVVGRPEETCTARIGEREPVPLSGQGRPDGVPRYDLAIPGCPLTLDVVEGGVMVTGANTCVFEAVACQVEPRGMWGPEPNALAAQASALEQARGQADRAVRENYRTLTQRAKPGEVRAIVTEQAAFTSEREQLCRTYAREGAHGFCNARFTEARALSLAARLGLLATPEPPAARGRRPPPASAAASPPGGPPPSPE